MYWSDYFEKTKTKTVSPLLEQAYLLAPARDSALDLGAGALIDTKFLLSVGFQTVTAVDADPAIKKYARGFTTNQLKFKIAAFENVALGTNCYDFILANFSLPFTSPPHLPRVFSGIIKSLKPEGIFAGNFFGPKDSWAKKEKHLTFLNLDQVHELIRPLKIIHFQEKEWDGSTIDGQSKHWHTFDIIAQKPKHKHD
ncbi:class I SAM-dependent methyltransferase [Candidatus Peregrinibacteria bacterium]|nr:class I SAM-dependent methyltransferase [Candidatus Peregrinibacteria bacterium]